MGKTVGKSASKRKQTAAQKSTQFKPGNPGGPGRPKMPEGFRNVKRMTQLQLSELGIALLNQNLDDLKKLEKNPEASALQVGYIRIAITAIENRDLDTIEKMISRFVGPIGARHEFTGIPAPQAPVAAAPTIVVNVPANGREAK